MELRTESITTQLNTISVARRQFPVIQCSAALEMEETAPEGGWGYIACFGMIITFIAGMGHINSFGLIYNDFINETNSTTKYLTTAHGVFGMMLAVGGLILNLVSKKSLRLGGFIGASIFCVGSFSTIFITNTNQLPLTFGILQGIGFGMMVPVSYSVLNHYFVRKRTSVMSACKALQGIILMWYPQLIKNMVTNYGFRGTLLVISGMSLHTFPGMAVMKTNAVMRNTITANKNHRDKDTVGDENVDLINDNTLLNINDKDKKKKLRLRIYETFALKMLQDPVYLNICLGQSFVNFSDFTFFMLQPMLLFQYGYSRTQVAICISIGAGADVAGRFALAIVSSFTSINTRIIYYIASLLTLIFRIAMLQTQQLIWIEISMVLLGVFHAWLHVTSPLVISNHVAREDFPGAYSLFLLATGTVNLTLSPLIGLIKDMYEDYTPAFYALSACCLPCLIFWPVEYIWKTKRSILMQT
ncbi:hypothetical protein ACJJTC_012671 [Scirpophaga incertulas]